MERSSLNPPGVPHRPVYSVFTKLVLGTALVAALAFTGCESNLQKYRDQGVLEYQKGDYSNSLVSLTKALSYDEFDPKSNAYAGMIHYQAGEYVQAAYHFQVALQADPSSEEAKNGLTETYIKQGKPDQALDALERSSEMAQKVDDPRWEKTNVKRHYTKGTEERLFLGKVDDRMRIARTYEKLGDYDNALVYYKKALELDPESVDVLMAAANLAEKAGNKPEAREYLRRAYGIDPGAKGLTDAMTRNGLAISDVLDVPATKPAGVPAATAPQ